MQLRTWESSGAKARFFFNTPYVPSVALFRIKNRYLRKLAPMTE
jgi:hypothetical protein